MEDIYIVALDSTPTQVNTSVPSGLQKSPVTIPFLPDDVLGYIVSFISYVHEVDMHMRVTVDFSHLENVALVPKGLRRLVKRKKSQIAEDYERRKRLFKKVDEWCEDKAAAQAKYGHISDWDITGVTDLRALFSPHRNGGASSFNEDISRWDVSNVTDMHSIFSGAESFNCDLSSWNVGKVKDMSKMFDGAESFDCDVSLWDVRSAKNLNFMFQRASSFNCN
ncbi:hypothetical protein TrVE_jg126 [Triparma verrucosa]|uniref:BspA family leucine-rich repeat surface protein n=1 Tax=Triparma verrucosa TaxID=1606542 RepID=A0A9W7FJG6_9STRA|nr:hypothetical protein TrVE_jg126 [Triparma verrucosa]